MDEGPFGGDDLGGGYRGHLGHRDDCKDGLVAHHSGLCCLRNRRWSGQHLGGLFVPAVRADDEFMLGIAT